MDEEGKNKKDLVTAQALRGDEEKNVVAVRSFSELQLAESEESS